jgi:hypothetical protein
LKARVVAQAIEPGIDLQQYHPLAMQQKLRLATVSRADSVQLSLLGRLTKALLKAG